MEVISKQDTNLWERDHICGNCDSKLKINIQDLIFQIELQGFHDTESESYYVRCPICSDLCSKLSYVQQQDIPKLVQLEVKENAQKLLKETPLKKSFINRLLNWG